MILTALVISRATYILRTHTLPAAYTLRGRTHYSILMNNYTQDFYSEVIEFDAVYNHHDSYQQRKYKKNARRSQRRNKQQQKNARYDSF